MPEARDIDVVVFDVLGTLVDEASGLRTDIRAALPATDEALVEELLVLWQRHVEVTQGQMNQGLRRYASTEVVDLEAAQLVADRAGLTDPAVAAGRGPSDGSR